MMTVWYRWLDTRFTGTSTRYVTEHRESDVFKCRLCFSVVAKKVLLDQTGLTIPVLFVFFTTMSYLEGKDDITKDFVDKFPVTFAVGCCRLQIEDIWTPEGLYYIRVYSK
jgi:hypothetical protein